MLISEMILFNDKAQYKQCVPNKVWVLALSMIALKNQIK